MKMPNWLPRPPTTMMVKALMVKTSGTVGVIT